MIRCMDSLKEATERRRKRPTRIEGNCNTRSDHCVSGSHVVLLSQLIALLMDLNLWKPLKLLFTKAVILWKGLRLHLWTESTSVVSAAPWSWQPVGCQVFDVRKGCEENKLVITGSSCTHHNYDQSLREENTSFQALFYWKKPSFALL